MRLVLGYEKSFLISLPFISPPTFMMSRSFSVSMSLVYFCVSLSVGFCLTVCVYSPHSLSPYSDQKH